MMMKVCGFVTCDLFHIRTSDLMHCLVDGCPRSNLIKRIHSHTDSFAFGGNLGFSILPRDTSAQNAGVRVQTTNLFAPAQPPKARCGIRHYWSIL